MLNSGEATAVYPLCLIQTASKDLLQPFSNQKFDLGSEGIALVGCGSLGSKIAIHMARSGHAPGRVIDKGYLSPHNAARHALLPETNTMQLGWQRQKANALASAIRSLNQETKEFHADASLVTHNSELRKQLFPNKVRTIINATASVTVREALAQLPTNKLAARVIETSLFANGKLGFLSYEGANRNPNTLDLITFAYQLMHDELDLRELVLEKLEEGQYQSTGQGCGSLTMRIADSLISLHAASMTQGITSLLENFSESSGCLSLGRLAGDGMSLKWQTYKVSPSQIVQIENAPNWQVRVADHIHQKIIAECAYFPNVETGGVIIGRISYCSQSFLVTDIIPAPKDSERTPDQFILGIQGITEAIAQYEKNSNGTLPCLGTWHSHLYHSDPSGEDYKVAAVLAKSRKIPFAMLIHTPGGYKAILADKEYLKDEH
ncbi:hypothetical protein C7B76_32360 [filamentous cyanobacterium CCP2]|nr:hypothetical protein C7B76_32360 [filamentous cyanobacterium CCP2]